MTIFFGYEDFKNGEATTNGFDFVLNKSPINLGFAGYMTDRNVKDYEIDHMSDLFPPYHSHHYFDLKHYYDIEVKKIDEIKEKYYYPIDIYTGEFWTDEESKYLKLSDRAASDIKEGKSKILLLFPLEAIKNSYDISPLINAWKHTYQLPPRSVVIVSGNYSCKDRLENEENISYIPYSMWEDTFLEVYDQNHVDKMCLIIEERYNRVKVFLNYNRRARYPRCKLVYEIMKAEVGEYGFVSLGVPVGHMNKSIPIDFFKKLPLTFDNTDLEINHATELVQTDFLNSYVSLVSETMIKSGEIFPTEKIFKAIAGFHPFIVVASPGFLELLKDFGYETFSNWFDESYDKEENLEKRIDMILSEIKKLTLKSHSELQDMSLEMLPVLKHNVNNFLKRTREDKTFQKQLEVELWK